MSDIKDFASIKEICTYIKSKNLDLIICADSNVERIYAKELESLKSINNQKWFTFPQGENAKNLAEWERAVEFFIERGVNRKTVLVAIGGGALSDVSGFVASTLLRGIQWIVIPTTILSQIDASIGGKVAVNSRYGKNLIGNFHQPSEILLCDEFLSTLETREILSGYGELLKYAYIDHKIYQLIENKTSMIKLMKACAQVKLDIITKDPFELGLRKVLNLGHTFGHAIEWKYKLSHGESVLWGLAIIFKLFDQNEELEKLKKMIKLLNIEDSLLNPIKQELNVDDFFEVLTKDKKILTQKTIELIIVNETKEVVVNEYDLSKIKEIFKTKMRDMCAISFD